MPLRLIADVSDGLDDGLIGDVAFDGGGASGEVNSHFIDALQALQGLFHIGTAVVAHHAVHFEHSCFHSLIFFLWYKSHYQCIDQQAAQHDTANHVEQGWRGMAAGVSIIISPITIEHLSQYGAIYAAAFSGEPWNDNWSVEDATIHVRELLECQQHYGLECVVDGEVAGFILGTSMLFH